MILAERMNTLGEVHIMELYWSTGRGKERGPRRAVIDRPAYHAHHICLDA